MEKTMINVTKSSNVANRVFKTKGSKLSDIRITFGLKIAKISMRILGFSKNDIRDFAYAIVEDCTEATGEDLRKEVEELKLF